MQFITDQTNGFVNEIRRKHSNVIKLGQRQNYEENTEAILQEARGMAYAEEKKRIEEVGFVQAVGFDSLRHSIGQHSLHSSPHAVVMKRRKPAAALLKRPGSQFAVSKVQTRYVCQFPFFDLLLFSKYLRILE